MREIKLRAWHTPLQKMLFPEKIHLDNGLCTAFDYLQDDGVYQIKTENNMGLDLMQFTGLLDKNGKEIFEGDIVEWDDGSNGKWRRRCEIKWEKTKYILVGYYYNANIPDSKKTPIDFKFGSFIYEYDGAMEIIGSIYENPDLLNKQ